MRLVLLFTIILLSSCLDRKTPLKNEGVAVGIYKEEKLSEVEIRAFKLNANYQAADLSGAKNVGEFFDHRLRFFKIENPQLSFNRTPVKEIVLYFIDSALVKMRYELSNEVGSFLLDSLGMSRFKPLDSISKNLLSRKKVYDKYTSRLHPDLVNYELIWRTDFDLKRYRANTLDTINQYYFYHEMYGYKQKIRELEVMYNYLEEAFPSEILN